MVIEARRRHPHLGAYLLCRAPVAVPRTLPFRFLAPKNTRHRLPRYMTLVLTAPLFLRPHSIRGLARLAKLLPVHEQQATQPPLTLLTVQHITHPFLLGLQTARGVYIRARVLWLKCLGYWAGKLTVARV